MGSACDLYVDYISIKMLDSIVSIHTVRPQNFAYGLRLMDFTLAS